MQTFHITRRRFVPAALLAFLAVGLASSQAGVAVYQLGEQDFAAGSGPIPVTATHAAGANEAYPFNGTVFGDDRIPRFGRIEFTYQFAAPTSPGDGLLTLGLIGLDAVPGSPATVRLSLNGVEQPTEPFVGVSSPLYRSSESVVTVPVAANLLSGGKLNVTIQAVRASTGFAGNAIEADFSTLAIPVVGSTGPKPPPGDGTGGPGDGNNPGGPDNGGPGTGNGSGSGNGNGNGSNGSNGGGHTDRPPAVPIPPALFLALPAFAIAIRAARRMRPASAL